MTESVTFWRQGVSPSDILRLQDLCVATGVTYEDCVMRYNPETLCLEVYEVVEADRGDMKFVRCYLGTPFQVAP